MSRFWRVCCSQSGVWEEGGEGKELSEWNLVELLCFRGSNGIKGGIHLWHLVMNDSILEKSVWSVEIGKNSFV